MPARIERDGTGAPVKLVRAHAAVAREVAEVELEPASAAAATRMSIGKSQRSERIGYSRCASKYPWFQKTSVVGGSGSAPR